MEPAETKRSKDRSPAFPFISLARAIERAREFYAEEKRGVAPYTRAVLHWRYSPSSSGALQTVAALRSYGLMDDVGGSGMDRQLRLTDLALRIILDTRPDSLERDDHLRRAALRPAIAEEIHSRWADGLPSDATLNHFLVLDRKFNEATASGVIKIIKENQAFARLGAVGLESFFEESEGDSAMIAAAAEPAVQVPDIRQKAAPASARTPAGEDRTSSVAKFELALRHKGVAIVLSFSEDPTREIFEYLERYCAFEKDNAPTMRERMDQTTATAQRPEADPS